MLRILHIIDEPYDSGIVRYALTAASGLAKRGHAVEVWGLEGRFPLEEAVRLKLRTFGFKRPWSGLLALRRTVRRGLTDILVAHTGSAHTLAVAAASSGSQVSVIRTRGDARPARRRPFSRFLWRRTAGLVAANDRILRQHQALYKSLALPAAVIYEGREDPGDGKSLEAPTVGIVGRLDPVKGQENFIRACALVRERFPEARFLVAGRPENTAAARLLNLARELKLAENIQIAGHVPDALKVMRDCSVGVVASLGSEAVSRVAVEWMSLGRAIVATTVGCLPEYVEDGVTGFLVPPKDPQAMAFFIKRLLENKTLRKTMGEAARRRYQTLFTLEKFLNETERFYRRVHERANDPVSSR